MTGVAKAYVYLVSFLLKVGLCMQLGDTDSNSQL